MGNLTLKIGEQNRNLDSEVLQIGSSEWVTFQNCSFKTEEQISNVFMPTSLPFIILRIQMCSSEWEEQF